MTKEEKTRLIACIIANGKFGLQGKTGVTSCDCKVSDEWGEKQGFSILGDFICTGIGFSHCPIYHAEQQCWTTTLCNTDINLHLSNNKYSVPLSAFNEHIQKSILMLLIERYANDLTTIYVTDIQSNICAYQIPQAILNLLIDGVFTSVPLFNKNGGVTLPSQIVYIHNKFLCFWLEDGEPIAVSPVLFSHPMTTRSLTESEKEWYATHVANADTF